MLYNHQNNNLYQNSSILSLNDFCNGIGNSVSAWLIVSVRNREVQREAIPAWQGFAKVAVGAGIATITSIATIWRVRYWWRSLPKIRTQRKKSGC